MKLLKLSQYVDALEEKGLLVEYRGETAPLNREIRCLTFDTRTISEDALFVCKGAHFKEEYLTYALENGAVAYVSETFYSEAGAALIVSDIRRAMSLLALLFFDNAPEKITSVGITGTKGKSTTAYYMRSVLDKYLDSEGKPKSAIISSIDTYDGVMNFESHLTTPEAIELFRHFGNAVDSGISHLTMEVSSQALKYGRVDGINFDVVCFSNIGTDHISPIEHADFEDYYTSKLKIFDSCRCACINTDADHAERTVAAAQGKCRIITYGSHESDTVYCSGVEKRGDATFFTVRTPEFEREMCITMPGLFNVSNALATIAMCYALGIPEEFVYEGLECARAGGRMQVYKSRDERIIVIVDYAHNRMSFEALFSSVRIEYPGRDVIAVFGCPGKKAHLRRVDLGQVAGKYSDYIVITEEDSGEEPFESIARDIAANIEGCDFAVVEDRGQAIKKAILDYEAEKRIILLTGKGEETRQKRGTEYIDCPSDVEYTLEFLREYDGAPALA